MDDGAAGVPVGQPAARHAALLAVEADLRTKAREKGPNFVPRCRAMTLTEFSKRFLEWKDTAQLELKSQRYYEYGWKLLEVSLLAPMQLSRISSDAVASTRFVGLTGKAIGGQYANQAIRTLKVMLQQGEGVAADRRSSIAEAEEGGWTTAHLLR